MLLRTFGQPRFYPQLNGSNEHLGDLQKIPIWVQHMQRGDLTEARLAVEKFSNALVNLCDLLEAAERRDGSDALSRSLVNELDNTLKESIRFSAVMHEMLTRDARDLSAEWVQKWSAFLSEFRALSTHQERATAVREKSNRHTTVQTERPILTRLREFTDQLAIQAEKRRKERLLGRKT